MKACCQLTGGLCISEDGRDSGMHRRAFPLIALALFATVILLGLAVGSGLLAGIDTHVANALSLRIGQSSSMLITAMQAISWAGGGVPRWIIFLVGCALLLWRAMPRAAITLVAAVLASTFASEALKSGFARARPAIVPHLDHSSNAAFPSGHATNVAVVYLLLALVVPPRWRAPAIAAALALMLLTCVSRVSLGVHWPTDVVGGWMLGSGFALLGAWWVGQGTRQPRPGT